MAEYLISELEVPEVGKTLIFKDKEARNDLSTAVVETSASNPLTFTTRSAQKAQSAEIVLEPIQDLHGYDHPWPAGGMGNLFDYDTSINVSAGATQSQLPSKPIYLEAGITYTFSCKQSVQVPTSERNTIVVISPSNVIYYEYAISNFNPFNLRHRLTITPESSGDYTFKFWCQNPSVDVMYSEWQVEKGSSFTSYYPYSNICPISGHTEVNLLGTNGKESTDPDYVIFNDLTKDLGMEVYGASYNPVSGELVVTWGHISEYNGETLPGEWISDRDVYAPNTSPSTGAEVAYELATPITYQLSPDEIKLLSGVNTIWTDGTSIKVSYRDGKVATLADLQNTADNLQEQIDQNETIEDETTQLLYKLGVNNGLLFIEEV